MGQACDMIDRLRSPKILDMSIFDWVTSLFGAWLIGYFIIGIRSLGAWVLFFVLWVALGVLIHWMLGVPTMLGYYLGISGKPKRKQC